MHNHHEKQREIARSALPSTYPAGARADRRVAHGRERARLRRIRYEMLRCPDIDAYDGVTGLGPRFRGDIADMVGRRRGHDKLGPLLRWADQTVERRPLLGEAAPAARETFFRSVLPPGVIGNHAVSHLCHVIAQRPAERCDGDTPDPLPGRVAEILTAGYHADLNRYLRHQIAPYVSLRVRRPASHLEPARWETEMRPRPVPVLAGLHDIDAFVRRCRRDVREVVERFYGLVIGTPG